MNKIFISFRYSDGIDYKEELVEKLKGYAIDKSEDKDRSNLGDEQIKKYLYEKLRDTSITIVILTPQAINYKKEGYKYNDWLYDELRYSLENREGNRTNGVIALYTKEAKEYLMREETHICEVCKEENKVKVILGFENLVRENMMNVKDEYKKNKCEGIYDELDDSYISLILYENFLENPKKYIDNCIEKRDKRNGEFKKCVKM